MKKSNQAYERILSTLQIALTAMVSYGMLVFGLLLGEVIRGMIDLNRLRYCDSLILSILGILVLAFGAWQLALVVGRNCWRQVEIHGRVWQKALDCNERYWLYPDHLRKEAREGYEDRHRNSDFHLTIAISWWMAAMVLWLHINLRQDLAIMVWPWLNRLNWFCWISTVTVLAAEVLTILFFRLSTWIIARKNNRLRRKTERFDR